MNVITILREVGGINILRIRPSKKLYKISKKYNVQVSWVIHEHNFSWGDTIISIRLKIMLIPINPKNGT